MHEILQIYQMNSNPRGHCVVINNEIFHKSTELDDRDGTEKDVISLEKLFTQLHFLVDVRNNKTAQEIVDIVQEYTDMDHTNYDCFVMVILSHGSHGNVYGVDGKEVDISKIVFSFDSIYCQSLHGKPKLFFIQACQGITQKLDELDLQDIEQVDEALHNTARRADMFISMATSPGYVSWRNINIGTWFIQAVVYAFKYWAHSCELVNIMTKVGTKHGG
ncbi:hypothetical protein LOTGIDRAFT_134425 [Lottia gigantea]|uniref:Caspase family p20 domain-containing protein n=1 Tax=Lottia gigantea TaxID=225164 RepID=V3YWV8_LOTGI|nr:hypothetical protein LOTGIDRAFT_134425 [Lottia gigantea]ESO82533.1 hypothetical protein LOTGIDRAFT_134425 [Lottia gigantea]